MHFRIVVLSRKYVYRSEAYEIEKRLERRLKKVDYVDFMKWYSPHEFKEKFDEEAFVSCTFSYNGKQLRLLDYGLKLPKGWKKKYKEILVYDAHI